MRTAQQLKEYIQWRGNNKNSRQIAREWIEDNSKDIEDTLIQLKTHWIAFPTKDREGYTVGVNTAIGIAIVEELKSLGYRCDFHCRNGTMHLLITIPYEP
jgi:hypothetical protein